MNPSDMSCLNAEGMALGAIACVFPRADPPATRNYHAACSASLEFLWSAYSGASSDCKSRGCTGRTRDFVTELCAEKGDGTPVNSVRRTSETAVAVERCRAGTEGGFVGYGA
ncbi:hypothetical protein MLD38_006718 [Melastoma candidum]|uniref:Uncharacterized protein n=1 Tax=Melastoma candidum TaxID=119954 RepID=A0ACB9RPC1_9MYRT|nr:hypothetical protein MLD38_006718 [Melastoma candidum]